MYNMHTVTKEPMQYYNKEAITYVWLTGYVYQLVLLFRLLLVYSGGACKALL